jgi:PAS domain S-box-containing protein
MTSEPTFATPDGLWIIDAKGRTVFANEDMAEMLATTVSDLLGKDSFLYVFPEDLEAAKTLFAAKEAGSRAPFHFKLRRADGHPIWAEVQATPMRNAAGQFIGIVGSFTLSKLQAKQ